MPSRPRSRPRSVSTGTSTSRTNPAISERSSMIGMVWTSLTHGITRSTRSRSPPEHSRIGSSPATSSAPLRNDDFDAISWARRSVR